ncbi:hypothetical protein ABDB91_15190 [Desulfoscipio sp. XC116]|uniref:hypothetical protein n=1 Tax=Desulfoscipio sp. XC116 TaxID=3144975 RepID=UPI00325BE968
MATKGGERHHFISKDSLSKAGFNTNTAPAIRMIYKDHLKTPNWGSGTSQKAFRAEELKLLNAGKYEKLLKMEVNGFKTAPDSEGIYSNLADKYYDSLIYALYLAEKYFGIDG